MPSMLSVTLVTHPVFILYHNVFITAVADICMLTFLQKYFSYNWTEHICRGMWKVLNFDNYITTLLPT